MATGNERAGTGALWVAWFLPAAAAQANGEAPPTMAAAVDTTVSVWRERLHAVGEFIAPVTGRWIEGSLILGITWIQVVLSALVLLAVALVQQLLHALMRRRVRREAAAGSGSWFGLTLESAGPPLALFVWVSGIYAALSILFAHHAVRAAPSLLLQALAWINAIGGIAALFWFLFRLIGRGEARLRLATAATPSQWDDVVTTVAARALRLLLPLIAVILVVPTLNVADRFRQFFRQGVSLLLILAVGSILYQLVNAVEQALLSRVDLDAKDNLRARKIHTQVKMLRKVAVVIIAVFTAASMLMVFEPVRQLGTSILASAGIAGIIIGLAAQRSLGALLAGLQIAVTQPIRLDDAVVVEGEFGVVEEITLTYAVLRLWDLRRLVVPINYFIEKPFQNWTRVSAELVGTVLLYVDYTVPVAAVRAEFERILENSPLWDHKAKGLQVTDSRERTLEIRALVSAEDAGKTWDLRCEVREKLIEFLQRNYPESLPKMRSELHGAVPVTPPPR